MKLPVLETVTLKVGFRIEQISDGVINGVCMETDLFTSLEDAQKFAISIFNRIHDKSKAVSITKWMLLSGYCIIYLENAPVEVVLRTMDYNRYEIGQICIIRRQDS